MNAASFISDAASPKRPRVLLADDHPAMLEVTAAARWPANAASWVQWAMDTSSSLRRSGSILI